MHALISTIVIHDAAQELLSVIVLDTQIIKLNYISLTNFS